MSLKKDKSLILVSGTLAVLMIGLAVVGGFKSYSPVPFWDAWTGYLEFYMKVADGDIGAWWAQHNEHRIMLARPLFWADIKWFGGMSWFLVAGNYFLVGASAYIFWRLIRESNSAEQPGADQVALGLFTTAWLFLWVQHENLTWGFQGIFILAQLLPLCALYWLHKSVVGIDAGRHFVVACAFGLASVGTMANGILALPLMTFYALLTRQGLIRVCVLTTLSVVTLFYYFHGYHAPAHHGLLSRALSDLSGLLQYVLLFIGSPFYFLFGNGVFGKLIALLAGLILVGGSARLAIKALRQPREATLKLALLFFILYVGAAAIAAGGGRLSVFGIDQALSSRYTTPALMAWAALLVLYSPAILSAIRARNKKYLFPFAVLAFLMIFLQLRASESQEGMLFERKIAALALELQVKDRILVERIHWNLQEALILAEKASARNLSIFGVYPYLGAREQLGLSVQQPTLPACQGYLEAAEAIEGEARFVRVRGWIFNSAARTYPHVIRLLNSQSKVVGYALAGQPRPDVAVAIDKKALQAGYRGYLLADQMGAVLTLQGESPACQMQTSVPSLPF